MSTSDDLSLRDYELFFRCTLLAVVILTAFPGFAFAQEAEWFSSGTNAKFFCVRNVKIYIPESPGRTG